jgi:colanic acid/amylovoran biosynthesis protein
MKILLSNNHSLLNAGDRALTEESVRLLRATWPTARLQLAFTDQSNTDELTRSDVSIVPTPLTLVTQLQPNGNYQLLPRPERQHHMLALLNAVRQARAHGHIAGPYREIVEPFLNADVVAACGGGYLYTPSVNDGIFGWYNFTLLGCLIAVLLGKPLILLPQSIGPLKHVAHRATTRFVLQRARLVLVREQISMNLLRELGCSQRALIVPDLAFGMVANQQEPAHERLRQAGFAPNQRMNIGMTALNWIWQLNNQTGQSDYETVMQTTIDTLTERGAQMVLFPQCCGPSQSEDDRQIHMRLKAAAKHPERVIVLDGPLAPTTLQALYREMDYFIGTRMHSVIFALNEGVPTLAIGYLHKTRGMLAEAGLSEYGLELNSLNSTQILEHFDRLVAQPTQPNAQRYIQHAQRIKRGLPDLLRQVVHHG